MAPNDVNNTCDLYHDGWRQKPSEGKETSFDEVVIVCQEPDILYCSFLSFWKLVLLSPCYCWRSWHAKSDWFPVPCYLCCCLILSSGNSSLGLNFPYRFSPFSLQIFHLNGVLHFPYIVPCCPFFPSPRKMKFRLRILWLWQNRAVLNQWNLLIIIQGGKLFFVKFCSWYWGLGTVAQIISQWYPLHRL